MTAEPEQTGLLDLNEGKRRRDAGIARVAVSSPRWLEIARATALRLARAHGVVTSDEVRDILEGQGLYPEHYNAWGSVFRQSCWVPTGDRVASRVPSRHANEIRVWRLR